MNPLAIPTEQQVEIMIINLENALHEVREFKKLIQPLRAIFIDQNVETPDDYVEVVCALNSLSVIKIKSKSKTRELTNVRLIAGFLIRRDFTGRMNIEKMAAAIGRERTAMNYMKRTVPNLIQTDMEFREQFNAADSAIKQFLINKQQNKTND